jgi:hypothetical protein
VNPRRRSWPVLLLALPAFVAIWSGWVGLGELAGFGIVHPLPGIADDLALNTAITLPIGMEVYAAYALSVWLRGRAPLRARRFARWSAIGSLALGAAGQVAYHLLVAAGVRSAPWGITTLVACIPVAVLGMGAALAHLIRAGDETPLIDAQLLVNETVEPLPDPWWPPDMDAVWAMFDEAQAAETARHEAAAARAERDAEKAAKRAQARTFRERLARAPGTAVAVPDEIVAEWLREETERTGSVPGRRAVLKEWPNGVGTRRADALIAAAKAEQQQLAETNT